MIVKRAFKYRLKPNAEQREMFVRFAGARRWIFNRGLEKRKSVYQSEGKSLSYFEQNNELVALKEEPDTAWLKEIHSQVLQQGLKDLDRGYQNFFRRIRQKETPGHPKFKKRGDREGFRYPQGVKVEDSKAYLPKIGWVKFHKSRELQGEINETTIMQEGEHWYVSFSCQWEKLPPSPKPIDEERAVGIDVGLTRFATTAAGMSNQRTDIDNPRFLNKLLCKLRYLSRQLSKKVKKSKNCLKARLRLSKLHRRIKYLRNEFAQQLSAKMIKTHDIFCIESLDISNLLQTSSRALSRGISDAAWRGFLHCLKYKAEELGKYVVEAGKYFPSSQLCSSCGHKQKMPLTKRIYECPCCDLKIDRDYNSAIDLKAAGMAVLKACGAVST